jgi:uncharacterized protein YlaI
MNLHLVPQTYRDRISQGLCPLCGSIVDIDDFRDDLSRTEYQISGMCQECQDRIFTS